MSLLAYYKLDETSGNVAYDSSGNANHWTLAGTPSWIGGIASSIRRGVDLTNVTATVNVASFGGTVGIPLPSSLDTLGANFSICLYAKLLTGSNAPVLYKAPDTWANIGMYVYNTSTSNQAYFACCDDGSLKRTTTAGGWGAPGWYHIAIVKNGNNITYYWNGIATTVTTTYAFTPWDSYPLAVCKNGVKGLDDLRIYNHALTSTDVNNIITNEKVWYKLDEASGAPADELSGGTTALINTPARVAGIIGNAFAFDGVDDAVQESASPLQASLQHTVSFWFKKPGFKDGALNSIECAYNLLTASGTQGPMLLWQHNGTKWVCNSSFRHATNPLDSYLPLPQLDSDVLDTNWHHILITHNASAGNGVQKVYLDNSLIATKNHTSAYNNSVWNNLAIGTYYGLPSFSSYITIDQFRIFLREVNTTEIAQLYREGYPLTQVAAPTINVNGGSFSNNQNITLSCTTGGATIYYTTNGTPPDSSSTQYTGVFSYGLNNTCIRAIAVLSGYSDSEILTSNTFAFSVASLSVVPAGGNYLHTQYVSIATTTSGANVYYTLDGSTPSAGSTLYTGTIPVTSALTIKAIGIKSGYGSSSITSDSYTIDDPTPILCWDYRARYKNSNRMFFVNGGGKFPSELRVPGSVDVSTGVMMDEGKLIGPDRFKIVQ